MIINFFRKKEKENGLEQDSPTQVFANHVFGAKRTCEFHVI
jgi:hypothetical protein